MATNDFVAFAGSALVGENLLSQAEYLADPQRPIGNQPGVARQSLVNKSMRQSSTLVAALAQTVCDLTGQDMLDTGVVADLTTALKVLFGGMVAVVDTYADLSTVNNAVYKTAVTLGYYTKGDGGGGKYYYTGSAWDLTYKDIVNVRQFGAKVDGVTDDEPAINAAQLAVPSYGTVVLGAGTSVIGATINFTKDNVTIRGPGKLLAKAGVQFENMVLGTSRTGCVLRDVELDANKANRSAGQTVRFNGAYFQTCTDCSFINVIVRNTRGYSAIPGVGLTLGGASTRCTVNACRLEDCGDAAPNASDGVFTSGTQNIISNSIAINCTDTGFVLESSDSGVTIGCTAVGCSAGAAITNASGTDKRGCIMVGVTVRNWNATNTGGIQLGVPTATAGNLLDTVVSGVVVTADTGGGYGTGAAINVRQQGAGRVVGLTINGVRINGTTTQGILVDGDDAHISGTAVKGTVNACVQFQTGTVEGYALGNKLKGGSYGVLTNGTASALAKANACLAQTSYGIYALSTSTMRSVFNTVLTPTVSYEGKDAGATLTMIGHRDGLPAYTGAVGSAPAGALNKRISVFDGTGTPVGAHGIYS